MTATPNDPLKWNALLEQAAAWHVRLSSDTAGEQDWLAFETWLGESGEHGRAYEAVEGLWVALDDAGPALSSVVAFRPRATASRRVWLGAAAACLVGAVALGVTLDTTSTETYRTARGERRVIALSDGSQVTLNGDSQIKVRLGRRERDVEMADAEAVFDVAKDAGRPFVIRAGDRQIRVVGTEFNVLRRDGDVSVTVRRGVVEVRPAGVSGANPIARLRAGQGLSHREGATGDLVAAADTEAALAWTQGRLIFRNERLSEVARVLNRYAETPIMVAPDARDLRVTAALNLEGEDVMVRRLSEFLPVRVSNEAGAVRLSLRQDAR